MTATMHQGLPEPSTPKGRSTAARILEAATVVLARDGMGGATLGRIADQAGVDKRNISYYYGSREALLVRVVQAVGEQMARGMEATIGESERSNAEVLWSGATSEPELARAYITLLGGSAETPEIDHALTALKQAWLHMISSRLAHAGHPDDARDDLASLVLALLRGLLIEWTETGDGPVVDATLRRVDALFTLPSARRSDR